MPQILSGIRPFRPFVGGPAAPAVPPPTPRPFSRPLSVWIAESADSPAGEVLWIAPPPLFFPPRFRSLPLAVYTAEDSPDLWVLPQFARILTPAVRLLRFRTRPLNVWMAGEDSPALAQPPQVLSLRPPPILWLNVTQTGTGLYRVADPTLDRYELYRGVDASPDFTTSPYDTFTGLPHATAAQTAGHVYHLVLRKRDAWNLLGQNIGETLIDLAGSGVQNPVAPSDPVNIALTPSAGGVVLITANYLYLQDASPADSFLIYLRTDGTNPNLSTDTPTVVPVIYGDGVAKLVYATSALAEGTVAKAIIRTRRTGTPNVDSIGTTIYTATATLIGPSALTTAAAFLGDAAQQIQ